MIYSIRNLIDSGARLGGVLLVRTVGLVAAFGANLIIIHKIAVDGLGISGIVSGFVGFLTVFVSLGLDSVLIRESAGRSDESVRERLACSALLFRIVIASAFGVVLVLTAAIKASPYALAAIGGMLQLVASAVNVTWLLQSINASRKAIVFIMWQNLAALVGALIMRPLSPAGLDLVLLGSAQLIGSLLTVRYAQSFHMLRIFPNLRDAVQYSLRAIRENRYLLISSVSIAIYTQLEISLAGLVCSLEEVGQYRIAKVFGNGLVALISAGSMTILPRCAAAFKSSKDDFMSNHREIAKATGIFFAIGVVIVLPFLFLALHYLASEPLSSAANTVAILCLAKIVTILTGLYSYEIIAMKEDRSLLWVYVTAAFVSLLTTIAFGKLIGSVGIAASSLTTELAVLLLARRYWRISLKSRGWLS